MIKYDITEEEIKKIWENSVLLPFEKIFSDLKIGKLPYADPIILKNGYGVGMSLDYYDNGKISRKIRHIYISNPNGVVDRSIAETIALKVLGKDYLFIGPMSTMTLFHYLKEFE